MSWRERSILDFLRCPQNHSRAFLQRYQNMFPSPLSTMHKWPGVSLPQQLWSDASCRVRMAWFTTAFLSSSVLRVLVLAEGTIRRGTFVKSGGLCRTSEKRLSWIESWCCITNWLWFKKKAGFGNFGVLCCDPKQFLGFAPGLLRPGCRRCLWCAWRLSWAPADWRLAPMTAPKRWTVRWRLRAMSKNHTSFFCFWGWLGASLLILGVKCLNIIERYVEECILIASVQKVRNRFGWSPSSQSRPRCGCGWKTEYQKNIAKRERPKPVVHQWFLCKPNPCIYLRVFLERLALPWPLALPPGSPWSLMPPDGFDCDPGAWTATWTLFRAQQSMFWAVLDAFGFGWTHHLRPMNIDRCFMFAFLIFLSTDIWPVLDNHIFVD